MHRAAWVVAVVVVALLASARVSAQQQLSHKAYLPRVSNVKPTATRTVDFVGTSVAGTLTAIAPTRTPFPTQPPPGPKCNDILVNGGFEAAGGWTFSDSGARRWSGDILLQPFVGSFGLSLHPPTSESTLAVSNNMSVPDLNTLSGVNFAYRLAGFSLDKVANSDAFLAAIDVPLGRTSDPQAVDFQQNQSVVGSWQVRSFDILSKLKEKNRRDFLVGFFVENDALDNSWWYVDDASLNVCTNGADVAAPASAPPVGAGDATAGWRELRDGLK